MCLHFSYPDSIRTRARRFLRCIPSHWQVCFVSRFNSIVAAPRLLSDSTHVITSMTRQVRVIIHSRRFLLGPQPEASTSTGCSTQATQAVVQPVVVPVA
jgi:hypothetical protein